MFSQFLPLSAATALIWVREQNEENLGAAAIEYCICKDLLRKQVNFRELKFTD